MKIILNNGSELLPILVIGGMKFINGANRDVLSFVFSADVSLDELDSIFTDANCETIKIYETIINEDGTPTENEYIHTGYTIRAELSRTPMVVQEATECAEAVTEQRVTISMAQRTYAETQIAKLVAQSELHEECIVELASLVYA